MAEHFRRHPDADSYLSQPDFAVVLAGSTAENRLTRSSRETPNVEHRERNGSGPRRARTDDLRISSASLGRIYPLPIAA